MESAPAASISSADPAATGALHFQPGDFSLTSRQIDVLKLLSAGYSNHEIARALAIADGTVKVHVNAAFRILGVHNRVSAASAFRRYTEEHSALADSGDVSS
jgi:DNA-binding NarL/FixJ family response regulator